MSSTSFVVEPNIVMTKHGYYLATTPRTSPLRIGVIGINEDDAKRKFSETIKHWQQIAEENLLKKSGVN